MVACLTLVWHESVERANMYKLDKVRWGNILRGDKFDQVRSRQTVCVWLTEYCSIKRHRRVIGRLVAPFFFFFSSLPTVCLPQLEQIHTLPCPSKRLSLSPPFLLNIYTLFHVSFTNLTSLAISLNAHLFQSWQQAASSFVVSNAMVDVVVVVVVVVVARMFASFALDISKLCVSE